MEDIKLSLRILILQYIETMGAHGDDMFDLVRFKAFDIFFDKRFKETGFSHAPDFIAAALLFVSQDPKIDLCLLKTEDEGLSDLLNSGIERSGASSKIEKFSTVPLREVF